MGHVTITERAGVTVLTVDRPPANAMDLELLGDLVSAVERDPLLDAWVGAP